MTKIGEQKWLIGSNIQGIPKPFIDEMVKTCGGCKLESKVLIQVVKVILLGNIRSIRKFQSLRRRSL